MDKIFQIYGVFRVGYTSKQSSQQLKMDVLVMEYLFYRKNVKQMWDLKGSLRNRYAENRFFFQKSIFKYHFSKKIMTKTKFSSLDMHQQKVQRQFY
jgi:hypothetical protein